MKIGIIVYSYTGKTMLVAENTAEYLRFDGHEVDLFCLEPKEPLNLRADEVEIEEMPETMRFDALLLCTPVHGGRMSAPMQYYLNQTPSLEGLEIVFLLTHFFRREWGSVQVLQDLKKQCEMIGGDVIGSVDIKWLSVIRKRAIRNTIKHLRSLFNKQAQN